MSYLANRRIPCRLALSLSAGSTPWHSLSYMDRRRYGGAWGGQIPPESSFDDSTDYDNPTYVDEEVADKMLEMYAAALDERAVACGYVVLGREVEVDNSDVAAIIAASLNDAARFVDLPHTQMQQ